MYQKKVFLILWAVLFIHSGYSQSQRCKGYPAKDGRPDLLSEFKHPPKGYGNVPFYWWNGDSLRIDRLKEQLEILASSATDGLVVSYLHLDPLVDKEETKDGYGLYGKTEPGKPGVFTDEWWEIWRFFTEACAAKEIGLGMDDYTVGWKGNGYYPDELAEMPRFKNYKGELVIDTLSVKGGEVFTYNTPDNLLSIVAWPGKIDLTQQIVSGKISWKAPRGEAYKVYIITTKNGYLIHPDHGKELTRLYFDRFESHAGEAAKDGQNYFFQDELLYPITFGSWSEDFREEFRKKKGYDIVPYLPALEDNIGDITPKIRLDYCDVLMDLAEERYFKPIYDWVADRGLIYGSDNIGRGTNPLAYVDYFRANSWYTAPGNDAPSKGSSFLSTKVSSSISHLYNRPRTWLEAFHSMGWGSSGSWLSRQTDHHFMAGGNLLCMHGLYYSTHGGWWEWAPPCFHFRMPYWEHMKKWLEYTERLSYLMSQGKHVCDIAIMYPTESMQAYPEAEPKATFDAALSLSNAGLDYDFLNYTSLRDASIRDGVMHIAEEQYKIMVLVDMKAMHHRSLQKILEHYRSGGIVLASGELPNASTRSGENDKEVDAICKELFGLTSKEASAGKAAGKQTNRAGGVGMYLAAGNLVEQIQSLIVPDFKPEDGTGKVLHRRVGERDVYMVMDVTKGTTCFFRSTGKVELLDATTGDAKEYPVARQTAEGTWLSMEKESENSYLFVFSPGTPTFADSQKEQLQLVSTLSMDGKWEVELLPTMNNKWGDFRLPASDEMIGAEARSFRHQPDVDSDKRWMQPDFDDSHWKESIYGFGMQALLYTISADQSIQEAVSAVNEGRLPYAPYDFSWQYGVWDNPGSQGMHGLKGKVSDGFFILDQGCHQIYKTQVYAPEDGSYRIETEGVIPDLLLIDGKNSVGKVRLEKGWHQLVVAYANTEKSTYVFEGGALHDFRNRGAVVLFPESSPVPEKPSSYSPFVSMRWGLGEHLSFDPYGGENERWNYRFQSVPGLEEMKFTVAGSNLRVWLDGIPLPDKQIHCTATKSSEIHTYQVKLGEVQKEIGTVAFSVDRERGYQGAAVLCEPIKMKTGIGLLNTGDWSDTGSLKYYSGGMFYRNQLKLDTVDENGKVLLNLTNLTATGEVKVNGQSAAILMRPPYEVDITGLVKPGINQIEVLVYSTLSNHYQTIPTPYRGIPEAGLIGPVTVSVYACHVPETTDRIQIIPAPEQVIYESGTFHITQETSVYTNLEREEKIQLLDYIKQSPLQLHNESGAVGKNALRLILKKEKYALHPESYKLQISSSGIEIEAGDGIGLFYGLQSLLQLTEQYGMSKVPAMTISDSPRFRYRGLMIDVSRHFFSKDFIKKQLDMMAYYKLNYFHWHLVDGPGWRIEMKKYPQLTEQAAWRTHEDCIEWGNSGRRYCSKDTPGAYGGYYTREEIKEVVEYARQLHITVIPEIEMPGHSEEVLAVFPELSCAGKPYTNYDFCIGNPASLAFLEDVLTEILELFPSTYIHIGGDEAEKSGWRTCSKCQALMNKSGFDRVEQLQSSMVHHIETFLNGHGRKLVGWDEIMEGGLSPNATVMSWQGEKGGLEAARSGHDAIMTPSSYCYFNFYQDSPVSEPLCWAGYVPIEKVYAYNPVPDSLTAQEQKHIWGVQANLWTEYLSSEHRVEAMIWPRLLAISEVAWSQPARKSYPLFRENALRAVDFLKRKGYHAFELKDEVGQRREYTDTLHHLAYGKSVEYKSAYADEYAAAGGAALTDGLQGGWSPEDNRWQGFISSDLDVVIDLEKEETIHSVSAVFIQDSFGWFWMPGEVQIYISLDNRDYTLLKTIGNEVPFTKTGFFLNDFGWSGETAARYIRYVAKRDKANEKSGFIFTDEIIVK